MLLLKVLTSLIKTRSSPALSFDPVHSYSSPNVVVYVLGGVTYEEAKAVRDVNAALGCKVVVGGDRLWRSEEFVNSFLGDD